jgi:hypothetical protein
MYVIIIFHLFLAGVGFFYFSEYLSKNLFSRYVGSVLYMFAGALIIRISVGHTVLYCPYPWIPISLYFIQTSILTNKIRHFILAALSITMMLLIGVYMFFYFFMIFVCFAFFNIIKIHRIWKPKVTIDRCKLLLLGSIFFVAIGLSCFKLIPLFFYNSSANRQVFGLFASSSSGNLLTYFISKQGAMPPSGGFDPTELPYGFIGIIPMFFIPFSIFNQNRQKYFLYLSSALLFLWGMGFYSVAGVMHLLPIASALRAPERVLVPLSFTLIALSVLGFDHVYEKRNKYSKFLFLLLVFVIGLELITPFLMLIVAPANYEGYSHFTSNFLDLTIMTLALLAIFTMIFVLWYIYRPKLKFQDLINPDKAMIYLALFAVFNIFVVNISVMGGNDLKDQSDISVETIDIIKEDNPAYLPWVNFSEPIYPIRYNQPTFIEKDVHIASGLRGTSKAWYRVYKPDWNVDIGNRTYYVYQYEVSHVLLNSTDYELVDHFNLSIKNESYGGDVEPGSFSELGESQFVKTIEYLNVTMYVYRTVYHLPDVFIVRNNTVIPQNMSFYSPNKMKIKVNGQKGDRVVVKTSYYQGWKYGRGNEFKDAEGYKRMISFVLEEDGEKEFTIVFDPGDFWIGVGVSAVTVIFVCVYVIYKKSIIQKILATIKKPKKTDDEK